MRNTTKQSGERNREEMSLGAFAANLSDLQKQQLLTLISDFRLSIARGDLQLINAKCYVTHSGLLRLARRMHCSGIQTEVVAELSRPESDRWVVRATVFKSPSSRGFVGYGDADPSNVSSLVRGAEMRVAETRAVNRALRKAYGIGLCSVEELGGNRRVQPERSPQSEHGNGRLRDRLLLLIRQHRLDASQVKRYATRFCGTNSLREATREQVESFITHLASRAAEDRDKLLADMSAGDQQPAASKEASGETTSRENAA